MDTLMSFLAEYFYIPVILAGLLFLALQYRARWLCIAIAGLVIAGLAYAMAKITNGLISDPRPFIETGKPALIHSSTDNGFPSDHTLLVSVIAALVSLFNWRVGVVFWLLALVVGLARIYAGVHHLLDIGGSIVIVLIATGLYLAGEKLSANLPLVQKYCQSDPPLFKR